MLLTRVCTLRRLRLNVLLGAYLLLLVMFPRNFPMLFRLLFAPRCMLNRANWLCMVSFLRLVVRCSWPLGLSAGSGLKGCELSIVRTRICWHRFPTVPCLVNGMCGAWLVSLLSTDSTGWVVPKCLLTLDVLAMDGRLGTSTHSYVVLPIACMNLLFTRWVNAFALSITCPSATWCVHVCAVRWLVECGGDCV